MPAALKLEQFGEALHDAFGEYAYHVGSSTVTTKWRDVDVRLIIDDEAYAAMFAGMEPRYEHHNMKWVAYCMAFSELGRAMTSLPIDFQIQQRSHANQLYAKGPRYALGVHRSIARSRPAGEA